MKLVNYNNYDTDNFFRDFFNEPFFTGDTEASVRPKADLVEKEDAYEISLELPGVDKKDVSVEFKNDTLTVKGEKKSVEKDEKNGYLKREIAYGKFERSWVVKNVEQEQTSAKHENGVLTLTLPKNEKARNIVRQIEVR